MLPDTVDAGVLKILETQLQAMDSEFTMLTQKAQQIIGLATLVVGFATALSAFNTNNLGTATQPRPTGSQTTFIIIDLIIYGLIFLSYILATFPSSWQSYPADLTSKKLPTEKKIDELRANELHPQLAAGYQISQTTSAVRYGVECILAGVLVS